MILSLSGICLDNLPVGLVRRTTIDGVKAKDMLDQSTKANRLRGIYGFGPVPDARKDKTFRQVLAALRHVYGIDLDPKVFFEEIDDDETEDAACFPVPLQLMRLGSDTPILIVTYVFTPGAADFLDMDVQEDRLAFDLIEHVAEG